MTTNIRHKRMDLNLPWKIFKSRIFVKYILFWKNDLKLILFTAIYMRSPVDGL